AAARFRRRTGHPVLRRRIRFLRHRMRHRRWVVLIIARRRLASTGEQREQSSRQRDPLHAIAEFNRRAKGTMNDERGWREKHGQGHVPCSSFIVPCSSFIVPCSSFIVHRSSFRSHIARRSEPTCPV